jgi:23S rRNA pseudouridine2605 synthase
MDLVARASEERLYPIGRLDRNSTGVLLLTNDGDLAQKLSHPSSEIRKIYNVVLNKPLTRNDFELIMEGVTLEDGLVPVDDLAYPNPSDKHEIGIEIHVGRNRIIRRLFEHLGYEVVKLDRVMYAGLTKQTLSRGDWRYLTEKEVLNLRKMAGVLRK